MSVVEYFCENSHHTDGSSLSESTKDLLIESICVNSTANLIKTEVNGHTKIERIGNQTECGLLEFV